MFESSAGLIIKSWWLTEAFPGPPVWLLNGVEPDLRMQPQSLKQVGGATLGLADDVEVRQAAQTEHFSVPVVQVSVEVDLQLLTHGLEALWAQREEVPPVGVSAEVAWELLVPARALDARQEMARNYREQLQRQKNNKVSITEQRQNTWNSHQGFDKWWYEDRHMFSFVNHVRLDPN